MWHHKYEKCSQCGTVETPHRSIGLCKKCYNANYRKRNAENIKKSLKKYRMSEKGIAKRKEREKTPEYKERVNENARRYRAKNKELCYDRTRKWRDENRDKIKEYNDSKRDVKLVRRYGEDALKLMMECDYKCQKCGSDKKPSLHHIDWDDKNNVYDNFAILCGSCHSKLHSFVPKRFRKETFKEFMDVEISDITIA